MKKFYILLIAMFASSGTRAQSCLPQGITFTTQAQIDNFQTNYPNCTQIEGDVTLMGSDITNLNGLSVVTSVGGTVSIYIDVLTSLMGLENLTSIGEGLIIQNNDSMKSLAGLEGLTSIGAGLWLQTNKSLTSLTGLDSVTSFAGNIWIKDNAALASLAGLDNIDGGSINGLIITNNDTLSVCDVKSICDYFITHTYGEVHDNATGCNSQQEIEAACGVSVEDLNKNAAFSIYPNPSSTQVTIETFKKPTKGQLSIINLSGMELIKCQITETKTQLEITNLPDGVYFVRIINNRTAAVGKVVKL